MIYLTKFSILTHDIILCFLLNSFINQHYYFRLLKQANKYCLIFSYFIKQPVLRVHKDRHGSKSGQIVFHIFYNATYYMDSDTAKFSRLKWFKFVHRLISMWGIRKCNLFNPKLPIFAIASSFFAYIIYCMDSKTAKLSRLKWLSLFID